MEVDHPRSFALVNPILFSLGGDVKILNSEERIQNSAGFSWMYRDTRIRYLRALCNVRTILLKQYRWELRTPEPPDTFSLSSYFHFPRSTVDILQGHGNDVLVCERSGMLSWFQDLEHQIAETVPHLIDCLGLSEEHAASVVTLFLMPQLRDEVELEQLAKEFCRTLDSYPCRVWVAKQFAIPNLFDSDEVFSAKVFSEGPSIESSESGSAPLLKHHLAVFKSVIQHGQGKCSIAVDTQNVNSSSTFKLVRWLKEQYPTVLFSLCLYGDGRESLSWQQAEQAIGFPVTYHRSAIIRDSKSIVDTDVIAGVCSDYYARGVRAFIVISGDCDFMPLVRYLQEAAICFVGSSQSISTKSVEFLRHNGAGFILLDVFLDQLSSAAETQLPNTSRREIMRSLQKMPLNASSVLEQVISVAHEKGCMINESVACEVLRDLLSTYTILLGTDGFFHFTRVTKD